MATQQSQVLSLGNQAIQITQQIDSLYETVCQFLEQWQDDNAQSVVLALATCALNADGSLGQADAAPNNAHPINTALYPGLSRAISASDLLALQTYPISNFKAMVEGAAIAAVPSMRSLINKATGG
jgi:hypothetical protein